MASAPSPPSGRLWHCHFLTLRAFFLPGGGSLPAMPEPYSSCLFGLPLCFRQVRASVSGIAWALAAFLPPPVLACAPRQVCCWRWLWVWRSAVCSRLSLFVLLACLLLRSMPGIPALRLLCFGLVSACPLGCAVPTTWEDCLSALTRLQLWLAHVELDFVCCLLFR